MNFVVEVVRPAGAPASLPTHFEFEAQEKQPGETDAAYAERLRSQADTLIHELWASSGYFPPDSVAHPSYNIEFDVYRDENGDHRGTDAEKLGMRPDGTALPWSTGGLSRFRANITPRVDEHPGAHVTLPNDIGIPADKLRDLRAALGRLTYDADGQPGVSNQEKQSFLAHFEDMIRSNPEWAPYYSVIVGRGQVHFDGGPTGNEAITRVYDDVSVDRAGFSSRNTDWWNTRLGRTPRADNGEGNPLLADLQGLSSADFRAARENNRRLRQQWEAFLLQFISLIGNGDMLALRKWAQITAFVRALQEGDKGLSLAQITSTVGQRNQEIGNRLAEIAGHERPTPADQSEMRRLSLEQNMNSSLLTLVQSTTEDSNTSRRSAEEFAKSLTDDAAHSEPGMARWG
jgi:hypothetical protein